MTDFPSAELIVSKYLALRHHVQKRTKEFEELGALTDEDMECLCDVRQLASMLDDTEANDIANLPWTEMPGLLRHLADRLEQLCTPMKIYKEGMEALEGVANLLLESTGQKALSTTAGTAFRTSFMSVTVSSDDGARDAFLAFVRQTNGWQFITNHVNKEAVKDWLDRKGEDGKPINEPPPGVKVEWLPRVTFRKS